MGPPPHEFLEWGFLNRNQPNQNSADTNMFLFFYPKSHYFGISNFPNVAKMPSNDNLHGRDGMDNIPSASRCMGNLRIRSGEYAPNQPKHTRADTAMQKLNPGFIKIIYSKKWLSREVHMGSTCLLFPRKAKEWEFPNSWLVPESPFQTTSQKISWKLLLKERRKNKITIWDRRSALSQVFLPWRNGTADGPNLEIWSGKTRQIHE